MKQTFYEQISKQQMVNQMVSQSLKDRATIRKLYKQKLIKKQELVEFEALQKKLFEVLYEISNGGQFRV